MATQTGYQRKWVLLLSESFQKQNGKEEEVSSLQKNLFLGDINNYI